MKLIALLIALAIERLATHLFRMRELRWLDRILDAGFSQISRLANWPPILPIAGLVFLLVVPVLLVWMSLGDALLGFPYLVFAIFVLFFSFGPQDIAEEVDDYCAALSSNDSEQVRTTAKILLEHDPPDFAQERNRQIEEAVCVQANNRLFAVIFWFVLLGPVGAWAYRVTDLTRRRAVFAAARDSDSETPASQVVAATEALHGWLAWIPARLTAIGYALAGSFDGAWSAWRLSSHEVGRVSRDVSEGLLARVGVGALAIVPVVDEVEAERGIRGAIAAKRLVLRALFIWAAVIAAMTLYGWSV
ncbi:MAG: regulatory signaling modulator protein AmpE [Woeseia sp.]